MRFLVLALPFLLIPTPTLASGGAWWSSFLDYSWPLMSLVLGLIDGFNPCAMWTLFVLLGFIFTLEESRKRWLIGGVFIGSSGLIYFGALLAYLLGFEWITSWLAAHTLKWAFMMVGILALGSGFWAVFNYRQKGLECDVRNQDSKKAFYQKLTEIMERKNIYFLLAGMVVLAFSVNTFELLCSFAIPTVFTSTLIALELGWWEKITALLLYDAAYIFDDLLVFVIAVKTLSLKVFSPQLVQRANLIGGVVLIFLGLFLLIDPGTFMKVVGTLNA